MNIRIVALALALMMGCTTTTTALAQEIPHARDQLTYSFAPLVKQASPAVVNIYAHKIVRQRMVNPFMNDPFFREFFGRSLPPGLSRERAENSLGSGVIVRPEGLVVTNHHVIANADEIKIVMSDRREFSATIEVSDPKTDLAVLRIQETQGQRFQALELRDSDTIEVGDLVLAIGNPFGIGQTVTSGVISAIARTDIGNNDLNYYLQTDAAINPGNSGGALVSMDGKLVGVNTAIFTESGGSIGIGFAIPSNLVRATINAVETGQKRLVRPWLGLDGQDVTADIAQSLGLGKPQGVLVTKIRPHSPAQKAGVAVGDVIRSLDGKMVADLEELRFRIATMAVGATARLSLLNPQSGQERVVNMVLGGPPETTPRQETQLRGQHPLDGITIANLSPALADELQLGIDGEGVVIIQASENSALGGFSLAVGDVLLAINRQQIKTVDDVKKVLRQKTQGWQITLRRNNQRLTVLLR